MVYGATTKNSTKPLKVFDWIRNSVSVVKFFFRMDERIIKREVINASIDVHPTMPALVIDYDEVNILLTHNGREVATEPTSHSKTIRLQGFDGQTDIHQLAEEIVAKCNLVNPVRLPEIEQLGKLHR